MPKIEWTMEEADNKDNDQEQENDEQNELGDNEGEKQTILPKSADNRRSMLRDRASIKPPKRYEINITEYSPFTFKEATNGSEFKQWTRAIHEELEAHDQNKTWSIVPLNQDKKFLDTKWVFKILKDEYGQVKRFKAIGRTRVPTKIGVANSFCSGANSFCSGDTL